MEKLRSNVANILVFYFSLDKKEWQNIMMYQLRVFNLDNKYLKYLKI